MADVDINYILKNFPVSYPDMELFPDNIKEEDAVKNIKKKSEDWDSQTTFNKNINAQIQATGNDKNFVYVQAVASNQWVITHNLGKYPSVVVVDSAKTNILGEDIIYDNENQITINFTSAFSGKAFLN